jgi:hypothetical protein
MPLGLPIDDAKTFSLDPGRITLEITDIDGSVSTFRVEAEPAPVKSE